MDYFTEVAGPLRGRPTGRRSDPEPLTNIQAKGVTGGRRRTGGRPICCLDPTCIARSYAAPVKRRASRRDPQPTKEAGQPGYADAQPQTEAPWPAPRAAR